MLVNRKLYIILLLLALWYKPQTCMADGAILTTEDVVLLLPSPCTVNHVILIRDGSDVSMTLTSDYSSEGNGFGWVIPVPILPDSIIVHDSVSPVSTLFWKLSALTLPKVSGSSQEYGTSSRIDPEKFMSARESEIKIVGPDESEEIYSWINENNYQIRGDVLGIIGDYIAEDWFFILIQFFPVEDKLYINTFLPPVTVRYQSEEAVIPTRLAFLGAQSGEVRTTIYVLDKGPASSSSHETKLLRYSNTLPDNVLPKNYFDDQVRKQSGADPDKIVVLWRGRIYGFFDPEDFDILMESPRSYIPVYLTRLDSINDYSSISRDISLKRDLYAPRFQINTTMERRRYQTSFLNNESWSFNFKISPAYSQDSYESLPFYDLEYSINFSFYTGKYIFLYPVISTEIFIAHGFKKNPGIVHYGAELLIDVFLFSIGPSFAMTRTADGFDPFLGFRMRFLTIPPIFFTSQRGNVGMGIEILPLSLRWNLSNGGRHFSLGILTLSLGYIKTSY